MATEIIAMTKITHELLILNQEQATGELVITGSRGSSSKWQLYFYLGRLVYATGGKHPVRRWYRAFKHHSPESFPANWLAKALSDEELWEVDLLNQAIGQGLLSTAQAKAMVQQIVQEVMFAVVGQKIWTTEWNAGKQIAQPTAFLAIDQVLQEAQQLRTAWRASGLGSLQELIPKFSPDLAPILRNRLQLESQMSPTTYKSLLRLMKGQQTLWDIALEMQRPLPDVIRALLPLIRRGVIELTEVPDLPCPCPRPEAIAPSTTPAIKALVACIDDSPTVGQAIAQILGPVGYDVLIIDQPLQGIPTLLERKPALIFLDLVMPHTNGYELCSFLRKTSTFQTTPIVILTGYDSVIDRVRAKLAGASDFLVKPPEPTKVMQVVQKYLGGADVQKPSPPSSWWVPA